MFLIKTILPFLAVLCLFTACNQQLSKASSSPLSFLFTTPAAPQLLKRKIQAL